MTSRSAEVSAGDGVARSDPRPGDVAPVDVRPTIVHGGWTVLCTERDGSWDGLPGRGLWDFDTRILSRHRLTVGGVTPNLLASSYGGADRWQGVLHVPVAGGDDRGPRLPQDALEVRIVRRVGPGLEERILVANHGMAPARTELRIDLDADFADVQESRGGSRQKGRVRASGAAAGIRFDYRAEHEGRRIHRASRVRVVESTTAVARLGRTLRFDIHLAARATWAAVIAVDSMVDGRWRTPVPASSDDHSGRRPREAAADAWRRRRTAIEASDAAVAHIVDRAAEDLLALRNWDIEGDEDEAWVPHAGVPTYTGLFGRDVLTAAWQAALLGPEMMRGALGHVAATQATHDDPFTDAQPGRLIHEMRRGPLSELGIIPQRAYYGTQTTPAMFVLVLSELWHWTGDLEPVRSYRDVALRALEWAAGAADADGDGFMESITRSPEGLQNQGWKDSNEAIRLPDGRLAERPVATLEEQAFHVLALERMAELLVALQDDGLADATLDRAASLRRRVHESFWMEDEGYYALALDGRKEAIRTIASNAGHVLATGAAPAEVAERVADRLLADDLFSGWGIRTLSSRHPSYNPFAYHLGTVWPVETATFAVGFRRYGLDGHLDRLVAGLFDAAIRSPSGSLPEALAGLSPVESPVPVAYPTANKPQAWSASAVVLALQATLGLYPFAPASALLLVRPRLPQGVDELTMRGLRVGEATVSIRFRRRPDGTAAHDVVDRDGRLVVVEVPPPNVPSGRRSWQDEVGRWLLEHAPGRTARALRIAVGVETELGAAR